MRAAERHAVHGIVEHVHAIPIVRSVASSGTGVLRHGRRADRAAKRTVALRCGSNGRAKGSSASMETGRNRTVLLLLETSRQLTTVAVGHSMGRDATQVGIVLVEVMLCVVVDVPVRDVAVNPVSVLHSGDVACREGLGQLGHVVVGACIARALVVGP